MRTLPLDPEKLRTLHPHDMEAYLASHRWKPLELESTYSAWEHGEETVICPRRRDFRDFPLRTYELLSTLSVIQHLPLEDLVIAIRTIRTDVYSYRAESEGTITGTIPLPEGLDFIVEASHSVLAAANAAVSARATFAGKRPAKVAEYMDRLLLGQTREGSYIVNFLAPLPIPEAAIQIPLGFPTEYPFERKVSDVFATALHVTKQATQEALHEGSFRAFDVAVTRGVSANLCESIASITETAKEPVEVGISRSPVIPSEGPPTQVFTFSEVEAPILRAAGKRLRGKDDAEGGETVTGPVIRLKKRTTEVTGTTTIVGLVEGSYRSVTMVLDPDDYHVTVTAHDKGQPVRCVGKLIRRKRTYRLVDVTDVQILEQGSLDF